MGGERGGGVDLLFLQSPSLCSTDFKMRLREVCAAPLCSPWRRYPICGRHGGILHKDIKTFKRGGNGFRVAVFHSTRGSDGSVFRALTRTAVFDLRPCHLGWREEEQPLRSWLWSPVSPSSEPRSASCPPPPALGWRTSEKKRKHEIQPECA